MDSSAERYGFRPMTISAENILPEETRKSFVEKARQGDMQAFGQLYDHYSPGLMGLVMGITGEEKKSEEILQQTFVQAWQEMQAPGYKNENFFTRMSCIARALAKASQEKENQNNGVPGNLKALELVYFKGYGHEETAGLLNLTVAELKTRIRTELNIYREIITKD